MTGFGVILGNYVRRALAYRWIVFVPTVIVFALVTLNVTIQPDTYESHAVLMPPITKPADGAAAQDTTEVGRDMLRSASERFLSTKMLVKCAEKLDPYPELRKTKGIPAVVEKLRKNIRIVTLRTSDSITVYATHTEGENAAEMAADIANTLTELFVESQREALENKAAKLVKFLRQEKAQKRRDLDRAHKRVEEFRSKHVGHLPDDVDDNRAQVDRLNQQIVDNRQNQRAYRQEIDAMKRQLVQLDTQLVYEDARKGVTVESAIQATEAQIRTEEDTLQRMLGVYDEENAKVLRQKKYIASLKKRVAGLRATDDDKVERTRAEYIKFVQDETRKGIQNREEEAANLDNVIDDLNKKIEDAQARILMAGKLESQYLSLTRDVDDNDREYGEIVTRLAQAEARMNYDVYDNFVPIQIEQRAFVPAKPASPDRLVTSLLGLVIGLGIGVGLAVTRYRLDASYRQADDLRALMPGAVLVTIPEVHSSGVRVGRAILGILGGLTLMAVFAVTVGILGIQVGWWGRMDMIQPLVDLRG